MRTALFGMVAALVLAFTGDVSAATLTHTAAAHAGLGTAILHYLASPNVIVFGAALGTGALTLADWAKRLDPDGNVPMIVELLSQTNEMLNDMRWIEGNLPTGHRTTVRTGLPTVAWRLLNQGVATSKSSTAQIDEQAGMLEAWSEVDKDLALLNGNVSAFRLSESGAFIEAMNQEVQQTLFYGNPGLAAEEFLGFSPRYSLTTATNGSHVLSAGGSGSDNMSIWLIVWGPNTMSGIFPKGSKAGLVHDDFGEVTVEVTAGIGATRMRAFQERWQWKAGLQVKDWRYAVRICNIDVSDLVAKASSADLTELMIKAIHRIPTMGNGKPAFYMNRTAFEMLDIQRRDDVQAGGGMTYSDVDGVVRPNFRGIPINKCDQLLETEATVS